MLESTHCSKRDFFTPRAMVLSNPGELSPGLLGEEEHSRVQPGKLQPAQFLLSHFLTAPAPLMLAHTGCTPSKVISKSSTLRLEKTDTPGNSAARRNPWMRLTAEAAPSPALRVISQPQPADTHCCVSRGLSPPAASASARFCQLFLTVRWDNQKTKKNTGKREGELHGAERAPAARYRPRHAACARHRSVSPPQPATGPRPTSVRDPGTLSGASPGQRARRGCSGAPESGRAPSAPWRGRRLTSPAAE